jgi:hypothetical protein
LCGVRWERDGISRATSVHVQVFGPDAMSDLSP